MSLTAPFTSPTTVCSSSGPPLQRTLLNATVEFKNYNPSRVSVMNDPRTQKVMGGWGNGMYLKTVQENLKTARIAWVPNPERPRLGDIWARALQEMYFKRLTPEGL